MTKRLRGLRQRVAPRNRFCNDDGNMAPPLLRTKRSGPRRALLNKNDMNVHRTAYTAMNPTPKRLLRHQKTHLTKQGTQTKRSTSSSACQPSHFDRQFTLTSFRSNSTAQT